MKRYTYKTKEGKIIQSDKPLKDKGLTLVTKVFNGKMYNGDVTQK
jgi:hypothetical protein